MTGFEGAYTSLNRTKYMPYVHFFLTECVFYGVPLANIIWYICARIFTDVNSSFIGPYFMMQLIIAFPLVFWHDTTIHMIIVQLNKG